MQSTVLHRRSWPVLAAVCCWAAAAPPALAQDCAEDICFTDRVFSGDMQLRTGDRGGVGVIDFDGDGFLDFVVGGYVNQPNALYHNVPDPLRPGQRTFVDVATAVGLNDSEGVYRDAGGIIAADYDNDGDTDLYLQGRRCCAPYDYGLLYRNDGGVFTNVTLAAGLRAPGGGTDAASWTDYDLDGDLDLFVARFAAPFVHMFRNNGDGTFTEVSDILPVVNPFTHCYAVSWIDYDRDGWSDAFLIPNRGPTTELLLKNVDDGTGGRRFVNVAAEAGFLGLGSGPMGITFGDYDRDGDLDIGVSDVSRGTYYENLGGSFRKAFPFDTMFGWGVAWLDVDNDGWLDFFTAGSWSRAAPDNLQRNLGGGLFQNISTRLNGPVLATQFSAQLDFNNDGRQDIIAVAPDDRLSVYENTSTTAHHWLRLKLSGDGIRVNRDAVGAFVRVHAAGVTHVKEVVSGSSTAATEDMRQHFGLGAAAVVDWVEVQWPRRGGLASRTDRYAGPLGVDQQIDLVPLSHTGDLNCDGVVNFDDIDAFVTALVGAAAYETTYADCDILRADTDGSLSVTFDDIDGFVACLIGPVCE